MQYPRASRRRWLMTMPRALGRPGSALLLALLVLLVGRGLAGQPAPSVPLTFDRYHGYQEVKGILDRLAAAYPGLARVSSMGKDFKGFDIWVIEITNQKTGPAPDKPAFYADGNIDADEPSSTEVPLAL